MSFWIDFRLKRIKMMKIESIDSSTHTDDIQSLGCLNCQYHLEFFHTFFSLLASLYLIFLLIHSSDFLFYKKSFLKCFFLEKRKYLKNSLRKFLWNIHEIFEKYCCGCFFSVSIFHVIFIYFFARNGRNMFIASEM